MTEDKSKTYRIYTEPVFKFLPEDSLTSLSNGASTQVIDMMAKRIGLDTSVENGYVRLMASGTIDDPKRTDLAAEMYETFVRYGCANHINNLATREIARSEPTDIDSIYSMQRERCSSCMEKRNPKCVVYSKPL